MVGNGSSRPATGVKTGTASGRGVIGWATGTDDVSMDSASDSEALDVMTTTHVEDSFAVMTESLNTDGTVGRCS